MTENYRSRAAALRQKQERKEKTVKRIVYSALAVLAAAIVGVIVFVIATAPPGPTTVNQIEPKTAIAGGFLLKSDKSNAVPVSIFFDPMCPGCGGVDRTIGSTLASQVEKGEIALTYYPVAFLDQSSSDNYSTRAANAVTVVAENEPAKLVAFVNGIYKADFQPKEGTEYVPVTDEKLAQLAVSLGVTEATANLFKDQQYASWIQKNTQTQSDRADIFPNKLSTPAVFIGNTVENPSKAVRIDFNGKDIQKEYDTAIANARGVK